MLRLIVHELSGLAGWVADVVAALGELGVGLLTLLETVFPPIPSEVVLPLAGYLAQRGRLDPVGVLVAATVGSVLGAVLLYLLAAKLGDDRSRRLLARVPLMDMAAADRSAEWFQRHGRSAVFVGRLIPGVRSLISLPAGAQHMPVLQFLALTTAGSAVWNALLVGAGMALGTQYQVVERYSRVLDVAVVVAIAVLVALGVRRRLHQRRADRDG